jgi:glycosyltransferase involved in cell wall biosynthesis
MRILVSSQFLPWPQDSGGSAAQFSTLKCLESDHEFTLVCPLYSARHEDYAHELAQQLPNVKVRGVHCGGPSPGSIVSRFLLRVLGLARRKLEPPRPASQWPSYPFHPLPPPLIDILQEELGRGTDLFQAEFARMMPLGAWVPKEVPRLFIHHQIQFVYSERFIEAHGGSGASYLHAMMRVQELAYLPLFDGVVTFSEEDRQALLPYLPPAKVHISPFPIPADVGICREVSDDFNGQFLLVASEEHDPNRDALEWLLDEIWPLIVKELPSSRLVVVGRWSRSAQTHFAAPSVSFPGFVDDLAATLRGGIMLVPLRIGSGIRVKILVALAQGVPVVTTPMGCEGLLTRNDEELLSRGTASEFAAAAVNLAQEPALRRRLATSGLAAVSKHYSAEGVRRRRNEIYAAMVANEHQRVA